MSSGKRSVTQPYKLRPAKRTSGRYLAKEFLDWLEIKDRDSFDKFMRLFEKFEKDGPDALGVRAYKALQGQGGIVQFTIWKYRILGFRVGNEVFLTNGFKKDQDETPPEELQRAHNIKAEHQQQSAGGAV
jgi:hypothetical protein